MKTEVTNELISCDFPDCKAHSATKGYFYEYSGKDYCALHYNRIREAFCKHDKTALDIDHTINTDGYEYGQYDYTTLKLQCTNCNQKLKYARINSYETSGLILKALDKKLYEEKLYDTNDFEDVSNISWEYLYETDTKVLKEQAELRKLVRTKLIDLEATPFMEPNPVQCHWGLIIKNNKICEDPAQWNIDYGRTRIPHAFCDKHKKKLLGEYDND
jgi:hypothetical protein